MIRTPPDPKNPVDFSQSSQRPAQQGAPAAARPVSAAANYAEQVRNRLKHSAEKRGGPPAPSIPLLSNPSMNDLTMSEQAQLQRGATQGMMPQSGIFAANQPQRPVGPFLQQNDMLPAEAQNDPEFRSGTGALLAVNQPALALRHGVIRNGRRVSPAEVQSGIAPQRGGGLRSETLSDLQRLQEHQASIAAQAQTQASAPSEQQRLQEEFQDVRREEESEERAIERQMEASPIKDAQNVRTPDTVMETMGTRQGTRLDVEKALRNMDEMDIATLRSIVSDIDVLSNSDQKKLIEEKLKPIDISDLIMSGRVKQDIPVNDHVYFTLISSTGVDDLAIKRLILSENPSLVVGDRYYQDKYRLMTIALGLHSICGRVVPSHLDNEGRFNDARFMTKFNHVVRNNLHLLASIGAHHHGRV